MEQKPYRYRHDGWTPTRRGTSNVPIMPIEEVERILLRQLDAVEKRLAREAEAGKAGPV